MKRGLYISQIYNNQCIHNNFQKVILSLLAIYKIFELFLKDLVFLIPTQVGIQLRLYYYTLYSIPTLVEMRIRKQIIE